MDYQNVFRRYEIKYLITAQQQAVIRRAMEPYMTGDAYGRSTICNLYYDTPDYRLIRRSLDRPVYKEKIRVRSYGPASPGSTVFLELKKKYHSVVYKRRRPMTEADAMDFWRQEHPDERDQVLRELEYCRQFYHTLQPTVYLCYDREAFFGRENDEFRITFDDNIRWRTEELSLCSDPAGALLLDDETVLMEVKTGLALPLWLTQVLTAERIYKTSFSKYGTVYEILQKQQIRGGNQYAG